MAAIPGGLIAIALQSQVRPLTADGPAYTWLSRAERPFRSARWSRISGSGA